MQSVKLREKSDFYSPFTFKFLKPGPEGKSMLDGTLPSIKCERTGTRNFESSIQLDIKIHQQTMPKLSKLYAEQIVENIHLGG